MDTVILIAIMLGAAAMLAGLVIGRPSGQPYRCCQKCEREKRENDYSE